MPNKKSTTMTPLTVKLLSGLIVPIPRHPRPNAGGLPKLIP